MYFPVGPILWETTSCMMRKVSSRRGPYCLARWRHPGDEDVPRCLRCCSRHLSSFGPCCLYRPLASSSLFGVIIAVIANVAVAAIIAVAAVIAIVAVALLALVTVNLARCCCPCCHRRLVLVVFITVWGHCCHRRHCRHCRRHHHCCCRPFCPFCAVVVTLAVVATTVLAIATELVPS
jgi:hypothetical protein